MYPLGHTPEHNARVNFGVNSIYIFKHDTHPIIMHLDKERIAKNIEDTVVLTITYVFLNKQMC